MIRLWNTRTGERTKILNGHREWISAIAFSPDGATLASGGDDKLVRLWNAHSDQHRHVSVGDMGRIISVAFFPRWIHDCGREW